MVTDPDGYESQSPDWVPVTVVGSNAPSANVLAAGKVQRTIGGYRS